MNHVVQEARAERHTVRDGQIEDDLTSESMTYGAIATYAARTPEHG